MRSSPVLVLVDPRALRRAHLRRRILAAAVGVALATAAAVPYLLALPS